MRRLDEAAIRDFGIPALLLMENAGRAAGDIMLRHFSPGKVLVLVGKGNNGGDGMVVARHLANRGFSVRVILLDVPSVLKPDPLLHYHILRKMKVPILLPEDRGLNLGAELRNAGLIVDAIFGVGLHGPVGGSVRAVIRAINQSEKPVVSIDVPSGLDADSGRVLGDAVKATRTITLALPKAGLFEGEGPEHAGTIDVVDIGIPVALMRPFLD